MKLLVIIGGILLSITPWMGGGRTAMAILVAAFGLAVAASLQLRRPQAERLGSRPMAIALTLWLGWAAASVLWSVNQFETKQWLLYMLLAVTTGVITSSLGQKSKELLLKGYLGLAVVFTITGLAIYIGGDYDRLTSTFYWANPMAAYLLPAVVIAGWRWLRYRRELDGVVAAVVTTGLWLTDSRGVLLVLGVVAIVSMVFHREVRRQWLRLLLLAAITFAVAFGISMLKGSVSQTVGVAPASRFAEAAQGESTSGNDRLNYLRSGFDIWWDQPVLGTGAGTFGTVHPGYQQRTISASSDAHNFYLQTLAEQGIVGFILLAWVIVLVGIGVVRGVRRRSEYGAIAVAALALLLHFGIDINGRYPTLLALAAILLALAYEPPHGILAARRHRFTAPLLVLLTLALAIPHYQAQVWRDRGQIYNENRQFTEAADAYHNAGAGVMGDPDDYTAEGIDYYTLADITNGSRRYSAQARQLANRAIQADPKDSQHHLLIARIERLEGNNAAAEQALGKALALDPHNHADYYLELAAVQRNIGKADQARATVDQALGRFTDSVIQNRVADTTMPVSVAQLLVFRAADQLAGNDIAAAKATLEHALRLNPRNQNAKELQNQL